MDVYIAVRANFKDLVLKDGTRFWSKFVMSWRHEIFPEMKRKVCHMAKSLSLSTAA